jgi:hypothetical protein
LSFMIQLLKDPSFLGALIGSILTGMIAIGVYKGNLKNIDRKENDKIKFDNYKEFKILENVIFDLNTNLTVILEELNKDNTDFSKIRVTSKMIVGLNRDINLINVKNFIIQKEIFLNAQFVIGEYRFLQEHLLSIIEEDAYISAIQNDKNEYKEIIKGFNDRISDSYKTIRNAFLEIKFKV